jgi:hypothetical protein
MNNVTPEQLAKSFGGRLANRIGDENMKLVITINKDISDGCCASHNYCDANMVMYEAMSEDFEIAFDIGGETAESESQIKLWNEAWNLARGNDFYFNKEGGES